MKALTVELEQATDAHRRSEVPQAEALAAVIEAAKEPLREELTRRELKTAALRQALERGPRAAPWLPVTEALLADPMTAALEVAVADAPLPNPPKPVYLFTDKITLANTGETITMAEMMRRDRERGSVDSRKGLCFCSRCRDGCASAAALPAAAGPISAVADTFVSVTTP
jgi:hypothetical protein